ncbi:MAG: HAMP domain-containing protein [Actinobacteria bacterium]|nr:HAMP domain-containing protein [Actinomycetota bacterium]
MRRRRFRPLDRVPSIKLKLGVLIVAAVTVTSVVIAVGNRNGWPIPLLTLAGIAVGLVMVHLLARGMTFPLREMAEAASAMARGDHDRRVTETSRDEVGDLARAFNRMSAELAEVDRIRRDLVANVSHELRTPIGALRAVLENLVDGVEDPDPETFRAMLAQVERLARLVDQLLDLSRLESGTTPVELRPFEVRPVLDEAVREARLRGTTVTLEVTGDDRLEAHGDPERIHQVIANLLDNALKHSPEGGVVRVDATHLDGRVRLTVTDEGPGIPHDEAGRVFERFYRADASRTGDGGSGLGLSIARWIVDLHGGDIRVEDSTPHGCRMVVELPGGRR